MFKRRNQLTGERKKLRIPEELSEMPSHISKLIRKNLRHRRLELLHLLPRLILQQMQLPNVRPRFN
jgi:hypothetical protein